MFSREKEQQQPQSGQRFFVNCVSHSKNLRRKLEADLSRPRFIETVYGVGYRFKEQEQP
jgi:DNA-binding response OmpR family regulator